MSEMLKFDLPKNQSSIIKVIGVGGGGSNAVNHMYNQGIKGVDFVVCNTDLQALEFSSVPIKIQLGANLTEGRGAGSLPSVGKDAAIEDLDRVIEILERNTKMLFITAGMGGGTGTGAAPVIAAAAKQMDILTVAIVTVPFMFEGRKRRQQAEEGIKELRQNVDTILIICNDKLRELHGNLPLSEAFSKADNILTTAAKGIAELITMPGNVNVDFADVRTVMRNSGVAIMGTGIAEGENRAITAVEMALSSPLLNDSNIKGASNMLLYISSGAEEVSMDEITEITEYVQYAAGSTAEIIWGVGRDESLGNSINITLVATGFNSSLDIGTDIISREQPQKKVTILEPPKQVEEVKPSVNNENEPTLIPKKESGFSEEEIKPDVSEKKETGKMYTLDMDLETPQNIQEPVKESSMDYSEPFMIKKSQETDNSEKQPITDIAEIKYTDSPQTESADDEMQRRARERIARLREMSLKLKTPMGLSEIEKRTCL
jgi:cell division protein FtsZ